MTFKSWAKLWADGGVSLARALLLAVVVMMLMATTWAGLIEGAAYLFCISVPAVRRRWLGVVFRHPVVIASVPFAIVILVATFYGPASWHESLAALVGWRRLLMLSLAIAVFTDAPSKRLALNVIVATCVFGALVSFVTFAGSISLTARLDPGIAFHNYATQGITLSVGAIICMAALLRPADFAGDRILGNRWVMAVILAILVVDIVFVLWGRTGYLALIVMAVALALLLAPGTWRTRLLTASGIAVCCAALLSASPHVRTRTAQAWSEIVTVDQAPEGTPIGTRVVMWRNTLRLIADHPIFGVGNGGFQPAYRTYVQGVSGWRGNETGDPHNQYLKILGEFGVVGLAAFLLFLYAAFRYPAPTPYRELATAALVGWCVTSLANSDFSTHVEGRLIFFWLGAMLGDGAVIRRSDERPASQKTAAGG